MAKNLLASDSDTGRYDGEAFLVRKLEGEAKGKYEALKAEREKFIRLAMPAKWIQWAVVISLIVGVVLVFLAVEFFTGELRTEQTDLAALICVCVGGALLVPGIGGIVWIAVRAKKLFQSSDYRFFQEREEKIRRELQEELGVPESAAEADAFLYLYKMKNGKVKYESPASSRTALNEAVLLYGDSDGVCIATENAVFRIPLSSASQLVRVEKRKAFYGWNKKEQPNEVPYKHYKIRSNDSGAYVVKYYYALRVTLGTEEYEAVFPPYEYEILSRLCGERAQG